MNNVGSSRAHGGDAAATILLVEDNDQLRQALADAIEGLGYRVFTAADALEALGVARGLEIRIDLVVSDLVMPGMNALELYEALRERSYGGKMLIVTGYAMPHTGMSLAEKPGVAWTNKPVRIEQLRLLLAQLLESPMV